jgi:hypothetical protein
MTRRLGKICPNLEKVAKTVAKPNKNAKTSSSKLNLKVQIIYIYPLLKFQNANNKPYIPPEICLGL